MHLTLYAYRGGLRNLVPWYLSMPTKMTTETQPAVSDVSTLLENKKKGSKGKCLYQSGFKLDSVSTSNAMITSNIDFRW